VRLQGHQVVPHLVTCGDTNTHPGDTQAVTCGDDEC
jgi:hypothetical protein